MISGAASLDAAILVVDGVAGVMPQTKEHILLAKQVGVPQIIVWVNKCDLVSNSFKGYFFDCSFVNLILFYLSD